jgi:hypothetical protein
MKKIQLLVALATITNYSLATDANAGGLFLTVKGGVK